MLIRGCLFDHQNMSVYFEETRRDNSNHVDISLCIISTSRPNAPINHLFPHTATSNGSNVDETMEFSYSEYLLSLVRRQSIIDSHIIYTATFIIDSQQSRDRNERLNGITTVSTGLFNEVKRKRVLCGTMDLQLLNPEVIFHSGHGIDKRNG